MKTLTFAVLFISQLTLAQFNPTSYKLNNNLNKIYDDVPMGSSINDIIANDDLVILGTSEGLSISEDNGESWNNYYQTEPFGTDGIISIGFNNSIIWVTTGKTTEVEGAIFPEGTGIKYSINNGETWSTIPQPIDNEGDSLISYGINTIRALPITNGWNNISYDISFTKNTIWVASFSGGLRKSHNMGQTWERVVLPPDTLNSISPNDTLNFSLQPVSGSFGPESWLNHRVFSVLGVDDSTLYVGTAGGINKSTDNGISWIKFTHQNQTNPISGNFVVALADDSSDNSIWAATWKAEDQDENWAVSSSNDGGDNWIISLQNKHAHNFGFKYLSNSKSHVIVPTDNGIFRSEDGISWVELSEIIDYSNNISIETNMFYSAASSQLSATNYYIWVGSNDGLARLSETDGFWEGSWKIYSLATDIKEETSEIPIQFDLSQNFPNPFNPTTTIKYTIPSVETHGRASVQLVVCDILGSEVATLVNKQQQPGNYKVQFDASNLTSGIYFYKLQSGGFVESKKMLLLK